MRNSDHRVKSGANLSIFPLEKHKQSVPLETKHDVEVKLIVWCAGGGIILCCVVDTRHIRVVGAKDKVVRWCE